ncbi:helix-turn-helix domain-containing protein [Virgibacillus alimentarius]|uniref:Uncharacterized protein YpbB n=1 Tax=Virgibacillus alimentarius TaxID=698769 RepID=A0ABS4S4I5_9BACI|nr:MULTISPECIES: helix-turn-helix domain-containing protein [Virgibacillus]MBP2256406.1 uncharacterized protein YpbB [Virgibacillus alimentarius]HLR66351.1 helix-turn-helix domain-containing protein [Virgibacillus sp.]
MLFSGIVLKCCLHINDERSTAAIFHLLKGKRSIQTVQDTHIYHLDHLYGIHQQLTKQTFDRKIKELHHQDLLIPKSSTKNIYKPTDKAKKWIENNKGNLPMNRFQGLKYYESGKIFYQRLLLLIQTLTNSKMHHLNFIPVIDNRSVENWVREAYKQIKPDENKVLSKLHEELHSLLVHFSDKEASLFVNKLTGFKTYGMSIQQLAMMYKMDAIDIQLLLTSMIHYILNVITKEHARYPWMAFIANHIKDNHFMTKSAQKTYHLLNKEKFSIEQIAKRRRLKENTICDHIVEIALNDNHFPIEYYVEKNTFEEILNAIKQTNSLKLKHIKEKVNDDISYFQIRLTLAQFKTRLNR